MIWTDENTANIPCSFNMDGQGTPFRWEEDIIKFTNKQVWDFDLFTPFTNENGDIIYVDIDMSPDEALSILGSHNFCEMSWLYSCGNIPPPEDVNDLTPDEWNDYVDNGVIIEDTDNRQWLINGEVYCPYFAIDEDGNFSFGTDYTSTQTGDFDAVATWGGGGFPATGDTSTVSNTHTVSVKGSEACGNTTVDSGGTLRFDGQINSVVARLSLDNGATLQNDGTIDQLNTGSTGYAYLLGVSDEPLTNGDISYGGGYWAFNEIDIQVDVTTGGGGCTFEFLGSSTIDAITVTANDTLKCVTQDVTVTGDNAKNIILSGTIEMTGASGHNVVFTGQSNFNTATAVTIDIQYFTISSLNNGIYFDTTNITLTQFDNCSISGANWSGIALDSVTGDILTPTNCTISGGDDSDYRKCDWRIKIGQSAQANTCIFTTIGMEATSGWLVSKDASSNFTIYGILSSSETPSAGYRAADITGDLTLSQADAYSSSFNTAYTLGANCVNVDACTVDASTTFDTQAANDYDYSSSERTLIEGTMNCNDSACQFGGVAYGVNYGLLVDGAGVFVGGTGAHTASSVYFRQGNCTLTSGTTEIYFHEVANNRSFLWQTPTFDDGNGTVSFTLNGTQLLRSSGNVARTFYNVIVNSTAGTLQYENVLGFHLTVANNLTITSGGTFDTSETVSGTSRDLTVTNDLSIAASGVLTGNASAITGTGDIDNQGTFTPGTSSFVMNGTNQSITGSWDFWHFTKSVAAADTLTFENAETYTYGGNVTLNGAAGQLLSLVSDAPGTQWIFTMSAGSVKTNLSHLSVTDSDASGSDDTPIDPSDSEDGGNTIDWFPSGETAPFRTSKIQESPIHNGKVGGMG